MDCLNALLNDEEVVCDREDVNLYTMRSDQVSAPVVNLFQFGDRAGTA